VVVAAEKVATTRAATTSRLVANLYFIQPPAFRVRQYSSWPRTPRSAEDLNARACTAALGRHVTGSEGRTTCLPSQPDPGAAHEVQVRTPRREPNRKDAG
jgi:hypothetical protein